MEFSTEIQKLKIISASIRSIAVELAEIFNHPGSLLTYYPSLKKMKEFKGGGSCNWHNWDTWCLKYIYSVKGQIRSINTSVSDNLKLQGNQEDHEQQHEASQLSHEQRISEGTLSRLLMQLIEPLTREDSEIALPQLLLLCCKLSNSNYIKKKCVKKKA